MPVNCSAIPATRQTELIGYSTARLHLDLGIGITQYILATILFLIYVWGKYWQRYERLKPRKFSLTFAATLAICMYATIGPTSTGMSFTILPCIVRSILASILVPILGSVIGLKVFCFYFTSKLYETLLVVQRGKENNAAAVSPNDPHSLKLSKEASPTLSIASIVDDEYSEKTTGMSTTITNVANLFHVIRTDIRGGGNTISMENRIAALRLVTSWQSLVICLIVFFLPFFFVVIFAVVLRDPSGMYIGGCTGCFLTVVETANVAVAAAISLIVVITVLQRTRAIADPWGLRTEALWMSYASLFALMGFLVNAFVSTDPKDGSYDNQLLVVIGMGFIQFVPTAMQVWISWRTEFKEMNQQQVQQQPNTDLESVAGNGERGSNAFMLPEIMADKALLSVFEQFLSLELGIEALMFITDVKTWKQAFPDVPITARLARARRLFHNYISPSGLYQTNLSHHMVEDIKNSIMTGDNKVTINVFDTAVKELEYLLNVGAVQRFKKSKMYAQFRGVLESQKS